MNHPESLNQSLLCALYIAITAAGMQDIKAVTLLYTVPLGLNDSIGIFSYWPLRSFPFESYFCILKSAASFTPLAVSDINDPIPFNAVTIWANLEQVPSLNTTDWSSNIQAVLGLLPSAIIEFPRHDTIFWVFFAAFLKSLKPSGLVPFCFPSPPYIGILKSAISLTPLAILDIIFPKPVQPVTIRPNGVFTPIIFPSQPLSNIPSGALSYKSNNAYPKVVTILDVFSAALVKSGSVKLRYPTLSVPL